VGHHGCGCQYLPPWLIGWTSSIFTTLRGSSGPHHRSKQMHRNANHSCFGRDIQKDCVLVKVAESGMNSFGRVAYTALRGEALTHNRHGAHTYSYFSHDGTNKLDLSHYKLTFGAEGISQQLF
jgi:hypothetical protein